MNRCGLLRASLLAALACVIVGLNAGAGPSAHDEAVQTRVEWSRSILSGLGLSIVTDASGGVTACQAGAGSGSPSELIVAHSDTLSWPLASEPAGSQGQGQTPASGGGPECDASVSRLVDMQAARLAQDNDLLFLSGAAAPGALRVGVSYLGSDRAFLLRAALAGDSFTATAVEIGDGVPGFTSYALSAALGTGGGKRLAQLMLESIHAYIKRMPGRGVGIALPGGSAGTDAQLAQAGEAGTGVQRLDLDALFVDAGRPAPKLPGSAAGVAGAASAAGGASADSGADTYSVAIAFASSPSAADCAPGPPEPLHTGIRWVADLAAQSEKP